MESLDGCSPTIDHQVAVETTAGGSLCCFWDFEGGGGTLVS